MQRSDDALPVFLFVVVVDRVVAQFEPGAGAQAARNSLAGEMLGCHVGCLLAQPGIVFQFIGIRAVIRCLRLVALQAGCERGALFALVDPSFGSAGERRYRLVIPRLQRSRACSDLPGGLPGSDAVFAFCAVGAVEADDRLAVGIQAAAVVEQHQRMMRRFVFGAIECEAPGDAFFDEQTGDEGEVAFAVLQAVRTRGVIP